MFYVTKKIIRLEFETVSFQGNPKSVQPTDMDERGAGREEDNKIVEMTGDRTSVKYDFAQ